MKPQEKHTEERTRRSPSPKPFLKLHCKRFSRIFRLINTLNRTNCVSAHNFRSFQVAFIKDIARENGSAIDRLHLRRVYEVGEDSLSVWAHWHGPFT